GHRSAEGIRRRWTRSAPSRGRSARGGPGLRRNRAWRILRVAGGCSADCFAPGLFAPGDCRLPSAAGNFRRFGPSLSRRAGGRRARMFDLRGLGFVELMKRAIREFGEDEMDTYAAALAFRGLFSLFPFLLFLVAVVGYLDLQSFYDWLRGQAALLLPPQAMEQVDGVIVQFEQQKSGLFSIAILLALWTASAGFRMAMMA